MKTFLLNALTVDEAHLLHRVILALYTVEIAE